MKGYSLGQSISKGISNNIGTPEGFSADSAANFNNRYMAANKNYFPANGPSPDSPNYVRHTAIRRKIVSTSGFTRLFFTYCNFYVSINDSLEYNGLIDFTVRMGVRHLGTGVWYRGYVDGGTPGQIDGSCPVGGSVTMFVDIPVSANDEVLEINRTVAAPSTIGRLQTLDLVAWAGEGQSNGTDTGVDLTMGGTGIGFGATATLNMSGGAINSITANAGGSGYSGTTKTYFKTSGSGGASADYSNTLTGDGITGYTKNNGGSGFASAPDYYTHSTYSSNLPNDTIGYGASIVSGIPTLGLPLAGVILYGDSRQRGYAIGGSQDFYGDQFGEHGVFPRAIKNAFGVSNWSQARQYAGGGVTWTKRKAALANNGAIIKNVVIALGINDINLLASNYETLATALGAIKTEHQALGRKVAFCTISTFTTGGPWDSNPLINQTPGAGCATGQTRDLINIAMRLQTDSRVTGDYSCIDMDAITRDPTYLDRWRVSPVVTADGLHEYGGTNPRTGTTYNYYDTASGTQYVADNITLPTFGV